MVFTKIVGIIGWPVSHSISPLMHNSAFANLGLNDWIYLPMPVKLSEPSHIKEAVAGLRALGFCGANVTVPYKEAILPFMDHISEIALAIGAVNTIEINEEGKLVGHNTDALGFIKDLEEHDIRPSEISALILGAGGSARAVAYGLLKHGCKNLTIKNRTKEKVQALADSFRGSFPSVIQVADLDDKATKADLIINTTSVGLKNTAEELPWYPSGGFLKNQTVYDLIYNPKETILLKQAANDGARTINGLGMLIHQGALAFEIWTKQKAPLDTMKKAVRSGSKHKIQAAR